MDRGVFFALLYFSAVALVVSLMALLLWPFLGAITWAAVIGLAAQPLHRELLEVCRGRRGVAAGLATGFVLVSVAVPLLLLGLLFAAQSVEVLDALQRAVAEGRIPGREQVMANPRVARWLLALEPYLAWVDLKGSALAALKAGSGAAVALSRTLAVSVIGGLLKSIVTIVVLFFVFRDGPVIVGQAWTVVPLAPRDKELITSTVTRVVYAVLYGIVLTCLVQGILVGIGFAMAGLPSPVFFGAIAVVAAFVPLVGAALVWIPGLLYLAAVGQYGQALLLLAWSVLVVSSVDNFIRPLFISGRAKLPFPIIALGALGGLFGLGFLGVIVGPLLFAVSLELFRIYREEFAPQRGTAAGNGS